MSRKTMIEEMYISGEIYLESLWETNLFKYNNCELKQIIKNLDNTIVTLRKIKSRKSNFREFYDLEESYIFYIIKLIITTKSIQNDIRNIINDRQLQLPENKESEK